MTDLVLARSLAEKIRFKGEKKYKDSVFTDHDFIGMEALKVIKKNGLKQKICGVMFDGPPYKPNGKLLNVFSNEKKNIGQITSGIYSPKYKKNIGLSMILKDYWNDNENIKIETSNGKLVNGIITTLPFPK